MFRKIIWILLFFAYTADADAQDDIKYTGSLVGTFDDYKTIKADIEATDQRVSQLETSRDTSSSKMTSDLIHQQIVADIRTTIRLVNQFFERVQDINTQESIEWVVDIVKSQNVFLESRMAHFSSDLGNLFEQYEKAVEQEQLLVLFNINDFYSYFNWLLTEQFNNLKFLENRMIDISAEKKELEHKITDYAEFMASYLRNNVRHKKLLQKEHKSIPAGDRNSLERMIATHDRLIRSSTNNLKQIIAIMSGQGMSVDQYHDLIFKTTGNLAEAVVDLDTFITVLVGIWDDVVFWFRGNLSGVFSRILLFLIMMMTIIFISRFVRQGISKAVTHKHTRMNALVQDFFIKVGGNLVMIFGALFALSQVGLDLTPILTGLGVAGIVIGFALQDSLSNFASGMMILIYRPFDVGDFVEAAGVTGKVGKMSLVNTTIRTLDNQVFMIPNNKIWSGSIKNITAERIRRIDMVFGSSYGDNVADVEIILHDIVTSHPKILKTPEATVRLHILNDSSVDYVVRPWVKTEHYWEVYWDVTRAVKVRFDSEGISIPFPQRELHFYNDASDKQPVDWDPSKRGSVHTTVDEKSAGVSEDSQ